MIEVDQESFLVIVAAAAVAGVFATTFGARIGVPVVVAEVVIGMLLGPELLGWVQIDAFVEFFATLGLGLLFFFAGYEIDFERIRGSSLRLAVIGWAVSLVLAFTIGGALALAGVVLSLVYTGAAMSTTALGTLLPILDDAGALRSRLGTFVLGAGAVGEFGPILIITIAFTDNAKAVNVAILIAFVVVAVITALVAVRSSRVMLPVVERGLHTSAQLALRMTILLVFALAALAGSLGLDVLLGGFVAGMIVRLFMRGREVPDFESKLKAVGFGFLIPIFFIASGAQVDISALTEDPAQFLKVPMFLALFLVVRGAPALLLYRRELELRERISLGLLSATQLPLVVAITTIAVDHGSMHPSTAASLVLAAVLSTAIYPLVALRIKAAAGNAHTGKPEPSPA